MCPAPGGGNTRGHAYSRPGVRASRSAPTTTRPFTPRRGRPGGARWWREWAGRGEPLNPEVIEQVQRAWGLTIRDGFGQTESSLQIGNPPGQLIKVGSMGRPMPGFEIELVDPARG